MSSKAIPEENLAFLYSEDVSLFDELSIDGSSEA
jgi:hypothetical protein